MIKQLPGKIHHFGIRNRTVSSFIKNQIEHGSKVSSFFNIQRSSERFLIPIRPTIRQRGFLFRPDQAMDGFPLLRNQGAGKSGHRGVHFAKQAHRPPFPCRKSSSRYRTPAVGKSPGNSVLFKSFRLPPVSPVVPVIAYCRDHRPFGRKKSNKIDGNRGQIPLSRDRKGLRDLKNSRFNLLHLPFPRRNSIRWTDNQFPNAFLSAVQAFALTVVPFPLKAHGFTPLFFTCADRLPSPGSCQTLLPIHPQWKTGSWRHDVQIRFL